MTSCRHRGIGRFFLLTWFLLLALPVMAFGQVADLWHTPDSYSQVPGNIPMRDPVQPIFNQSTTFYQGVYRNNGANNQTGGSLLYRYGTSGAWSSADLNWHADSGDNQFWKAKVPTPPAGTVMQYYFRVTFSNQSTTFLHNNNGKTLAEATAQAAPFTVVPGMVLTVNTPASGTLNADYTTSKLYADEVAGTSIPVIINLQTGAADAVEAEVWTNLNNRDRAAGDANADGIPDGILGPSAPVEKPPGYAGGAYPSNGYFQAVPMTSTSGGNFSLTLNATKTGAYRLSVRYRVAGDPTWRWYGASGARDHCITVAPSVARDMRIYEINVLNIDATGPSFAERSTLESLTDNTRWNLSWLRNLGANTLWFQPIHPNGIDGREPSGGWTNPATPAYDPGSPYAVKNFFEVNELMTVNYSGSASGAANRAASMTAFQNFVQVADAEGVNVMLDAPFNHTAHDAELAPAGVQLLAAAGVSTNGWTPTDEIRNREARFFSRNDGSLAYSGPASSSGNIATAPDRNDFGKWNDVYDIFFGRYATLVTGYPSPETSRATVESEADWLNTDDLTGGPGTAGAVTRAVWQYFASYVPYWLEKTGLPAGRPLAEQTSKGIDGLRADFGQGMPPQFWEYCINVARSHKWSFVFMTESLDGGKVTYRSNRHFDILNENIVPNWQNAADTAAHRSIFEARRSAYGQGLVLLNNTSHDELPYADPWQAFIRYAVGGTIDGAPMVMYGQEIGTGQKSFETNPQGSFDFYELNFGKYIPHFKRWNSMQPQWTAWGANALGVRNLFPAYSGVGKAREFSPALRSSNRWYLNPAGSNDPDPNIFAVAKYETAGASPAVSDVVLGFVNLDRTLQRQNVFGVTTALADTLGLKDGRNYNVRNIAAYLGPNNEYPTRRDAFLWPVAGRTRADITGNGVFVSMYPVPGSDAAWGFAPFEPQYLRIYDVTTPSAVGGTPAVSAPYTVDGKTTVSWNAVTDPEGLQPVYQVTVRDAQGVPVSTLSTTSTSLSIEGLAQGVSYTFTVTAANPNDTTKIATASSASSPLISLDPVADQDGDGQKNGAEVLAGTDPLNPASVLRAAATHKGSDVTVTWDVAPGKSYKVQARNSVSSGTWDDIALGQTDGIHTETGVSAAARFYRVVVE